ncbi:unnamed protein product [Mycena citricolor]|uniref:Fatty acid desaturase domain-containing protein n=1 Tax=Mycena citricolor TaxID=2018698 RepID=A0AAD2HKB7_9AGAR|nr:unnamed protein product [Mycena citricolor]
MQSTFVLPPASLTPASIRRAIPPHLFLRSTLKSIAYIVRHVLIGVLFYALASRIPVGWSLSVRVMLWTMYGAWQGFVFAGIWCLGHEAGHDALSPHRLVNTVLGLSLHTFVLTPYFAWRATHRAHHKGTNHLDRDETYLRGSPTSPVAPTFAHQIPAPYRGDLGLPPASTARLEDYTDVLDDTPAYTLFKLVVRQFLFTYCALILALLSPHPSTDTRSHNRKGNRKYPPWTSHYNPSSGLFRSSQRLSILVSDAAVLVMLGLLCLFACRAGIGALVKLYILPWLFAHNWIVTVTYLQHASPAVPYYRSSAWTFTRGSLATVDRPLFGWVGRFFLHHIGSDHVAHHFFSGIPFYNLPEVTRAIRPVLGEHYRHDETPALIALWTTFTQCRFVEDEGDVLFFKNSEGRNAVEEIMQ